MNNEVLSGLVLKNPITTFSCVTFCNLRGAQLALLQRVVLGAKGGLTFGYLHGAQLGLARRAAQP
ncbi:hypothetical protein A2U01_0072022, partial [Trifolium medium]|nr:hypothetical protein [Trifolium medium]